MLNKQFWSNTIITQQKQVHYMILQMDLLDNPLTTCPIETGWEIAIELNPNWKFKCIDDPDCQLGDASVLIQTRTQSDGPEPLLILLTDQPSLAISPLQLKTKFTFWRLQANWPMGRVWEPCAPTIDRLQIDHLTVLLQSQLLLVSMGISNLAWSRPATAHTHGLQVHLQTHSITASMFTWLRCPITYPNSLIHGIQLQLQTCSIPASKCISTLAWSWWPSLQESGSEVHVHTCMIMASKWISQSTQ